MALIKPEKVDTFQNDFDATYGQFLHILKETIDASRPSPMGFPTLFIHREDLISQASEASSLPRSAIELAIDGFTVNPEVLKSEGRELWNPKQPSRALRRGFFLFPHPTGVHLAFSHAMAMENMIHLVNSVPYQKLPPAFIKAQVKITFSGLPFDRLFAMRITWILNTTRRMPPYVTVSPH